MPGGRPPKPTALKLLEGTARADRMNTAEPKPELADAKPPTWLKGRGRKAWADLAPMLINLGVLTEADRPALLLLCDTYAEFLDARDLVRKHGMTYSMTTKGGDEMWMPRPEVGIAADAWRRVNLMLQQFGLTPASRSKVTAAQVQEEDPFESFMNKRA